ncbi:MAG: type II secretion system protein [Phycisphaerales bacterium]|nr:type II secretion system protein [Phycisphaerales bacterium]
MSRIKHQSAFTLIELLVVISIIALLIGILLPALGAARDSARTTQCLANMRTIGQATATYAADNNDYYPIGRNPGVTPAYDWSTTLGKLMDLNDNGNNSSRTVSGMRVFQCPVVKDGRNSPTGLHYGAHPRMFARFNSTAAPNAQYVMVGGQPVMLKKTSQEARPSLIAMVFDGALYIASNGAWQTEPTMQAIDGNTIFAGYRLLYQRPGFDPNFNYYQPINGGTNTDPESYVGNIHQDVRWRHTGDNALNTLFADGHSGTFAYNKNNPTLLKINLAVSNP